MRILFLANELPDYLQDVVFHGLVALLGAAAVVEWPPLERYHSPPPPDAAFPMLWFDFPRPPQTTWEEALRRADAIVVGSLRAGVRPWVERLLARRRRPPIAFLDGEDDPYVRGVRRHVELYCKRETLLRAPLPRGRAAVAALRRPRRAADPLARPLAIATPAANVVPLPFGIVPGVGAPAVEEPRWDVAFLFGPGTPARERALAQARALESEGLRVLVPSERLPPERYTAELAASRIGVSVSGLGFDTYRYWEIPAAGALLLAEPPRIAIPYDFVDREEAAFAPVDRLADAVCALLDRDTAALARRGREKLLRHHTSAARAQTVLDHLGRLGS